MGGTRESERGTMSGFARTRVEWGWNVPLVLVTCALVQLLERVILPQHAHPILPPWDAVFFSYGVVCAAQAWSIRRRDSREA